MSPLPPAAPCYPLLAQWKSFFDMLFFCVCGIGLPWFPLPPLLDTHPAGGRHFRYHYLHGIECSSTLSNAPGRRSKNIKTQINSRQIRSRHTHTQTHTYANLKSYTCHAQKYAHNVRSLMKRNQQHSFCSKCFYALALHSAKNTSWLFIYNQQVYNKLR